MYYPSNDRKCAEMLKGARVVVIDIAPHIYHDPYKKYFVYVSVNGAIVGREAICTRLWNWPPNDAADASLLEFAVYDKKALPPELVEYMRWRGIGLAKVNERFPWPTADGRIPSCEQYVYAYDMPRVSTLTPAEAEAAENAL